MQPGEFWDVVAVTAADESQRAAYELQVRQKVARKELPLGPHYKVFSDPPGPKIGESVYIDFFFFFTTKRCVIIVIVITTNMTCFQGNGGSTLYALQQLNDIYGKSLERLRVILIHAGLRP